MLIKSAILVLLFACCGVSVTMGQQVPANDNETKEFKIDTLNLDKVMVEMENELRLTADQKLKVGIEVKKYLIKRMEYAASKYDEPEEWLGGSNNKLYDFSQNLEKILNEDQIECFWGMKPLYKDENIWWNIFVVF